MTASSKDDIYRDMAKQIERGTFHDVKLIDPPVQARGSRSRYLNSPYGALHNATPSDTPAQYSLMGAHEYDRGPHDPWRSYREPLKPLYTEKLPTSPAFKSVAELAQRRRDRWSAIVARGGMVSMAGAFVGALWYGPGIIPAGVFCTGGIIFIAVCFVNGTRSRS